MHGAKDVHATYDSMADMHEKRFDGGLTLSVPTQHRNDSTNYCLYYEFRYYLAYTI